ncbi:lipoate--protein ligase family protein [Streptococcus iniae]|uniref:lipoate--protein ligase family protein n=1 Tax=Streptococcus iniae TaxID=1346 RepID=UPI0008D8EC5C|nr:protein--protein lipoyl transferase [Streptococcus iniae]RLV27905.1 lipoate--protein ligase family protein [Streptococcus iniae]
MITIRDLNHLLVQVHQEKITEPDKLRDPFIWGDVFLKELNRNPNQMILHIWPMENAVILGMLDRELPCFASAKQTIEAKGFYPVVRNIGGLAVVADEGILNASLIIPDNMTEKISISNAYLLMVELIRTSFSDFYQKIDHYEIEGSYCPGNYDLSISGRKFAGLAQRRIKDAILVSIYLSVNGNQNKRGQLIADFYEEGINNQQCKIDYPQVVPDSMANLSELLDYPFSLAEVIERLHLALRQLGFELTTLNSHSELMSDFKELKDKAFLEKNA